MGFSLEGLNIQGAPVRFPLGFSGIVGEDTQHFVVLLFLSLKWGAELYRSRLVQAKSYAKETNGFKLFHFSQLHAQFCLNIETFPL